MNAYTRLRAIQRFFKSYCLLLLLFVFSANVYSQSIKIITAKFCPDTDTAVTWYKAYSIAKIDPGYGDVKCMFSRKSKRFRFYKFSDGGSWQKILDMPWAVTRDIETSDPPRIIVTIGNKPASYVFKAKNNIVYLYLKLKDWDNEMVFVR